MRRTLAAGMLFAACAFGGSTEKVRNPKVAVFEVTLAPGERETVSGAWPSVTVNSRGEAVFAPAGTPGIENKGSSPLHYVRVEFLEKGSSETWGKTGLAPNYKLLLENPYTRVYDIRIPAHTNEPQHTHHDRVVICLSGATLRHLYPDGREEPSTLVTGEIAWRKGSTHIGQNLGDTPLWVIAVEPK